MSNVTETALWEAGIYQIQTTDPVLGGANGIANVQARQLANRTSWLKARADQVDAARGSHATLQSRLAALDAETQALGPLMQNHTVAALKYAIDQAALANYSVRALRQQAQQQGQFRLENRGVVAGCEVTRSTTAARNLHIGPGTCFAQGRAFLVADGQNAASVPSNTGNAAVLVQAFLHQDAAGLWRLGVSAIGATMPAGSIHIYNLVIPAHNTDVSDPHLSLVTITSVRRIEPHFPQMVGSAAQAAVLINTLADTDYQIDFDIVSARGAPCDLHALRVATRATNGFTVRLASAADDVVVRWRVSKLDN